MTDSGHRPGWHPDPSGRYEYRYHDGQRWTEHVAVGGTASVDPDGLAPTRVPRGTDSAERVQRQAEALGAPPDTSGGGSVFDEPVLVVNQRVKLVELRNEYAVYDQHGTQIAAVRQVGQSAARRALRALTSLDQYLTHQLEICDTHGRTLLRLTRPAKVVKSTVIVQDPAGQPLGRIVQRNVIGKIGFELQAPDRVVGMILAENWRAWDFRIEDATGVEVARIKKTFEGLARTLFTTADNYVVRVHRPLAEPLRSLVVASALTVDTALKQDARGFG